MSHDIAKAKGGALDRVAVMTRSEVERCPRWQKAFAGERKDHRFYEIVEDTILQGFEYRYFGLKDANGKVRAIQPFFLLDQDMLAGTGDRAQAVAARIRRAWPGFLTMRTMMVGCAVGEGHLDDGDEMPQEEQARLLAAAVVPHARALGAKLIVLKEFPARYRGTLAAFRDQGFTRAPSMPMTKLAIAYADFEDYLTRALSSRTRKDLRLKFRTAEKSAPIEMTTMQDVSPIVDEVYPLYLAVYQRSSLRFEKLTKEFMCRLGREMPDKTRFFIWRQSGRIVAFSICMLEDDAIYAEYLGLDYDVALDLHLYHRAFRDVVSWGIAYGYAWFRSGGLNYEPKLHLRHRLDPIDLYVRHTSGPANAIMKRVLPWIEPTRSDKTLRRFPDYETLWR